MRNFFLATMMTVFIGSTVSAQVGIGTSTPDASAKLEINSSNQGFLPPRVALTGNADVSTIASPANGLLIYNTATAGSGSAAVTPGMYYYAAGKWQRVTNQQPDATVDFDKATPTTSGVTFTPNTPASTEVVYISTVDGSQWTYNGTSYVTYTAPASTAWYLKGGTSDAGSNKTGSVYRTGAVGIGASTSVDTSALLAVNASNKGFLPPRVALTGSTDASTIANPATGLLVYNTATAGTKPNDVIPGYYYYNGTVWVTVGNTVVETWSTKSPITIGAITTAPIKSTTTVDDYVRYRKVGPKEYEVEYKYFTTTTAGSSAGSGEYLFTLPAGLSFNSTENRLFTGVRYAPSWGYQISGAYGLMVYDGNWTSAGIIPYDATRFRVACTVGGSAAGQAQYVSSSIYPISSSNISYNFFFRFFAQ